MSSWLWADRDRVVQTITNLVSNAIKNSTAGSPVKLRAAVRASEVVISVQDRGCGIPHDHLERVFERFHRVDQADNRMAGGAGLGLSICRSIVEAHEGHIWARSDPGEGSTFSFSLPRVARESTRPFSLAWRPE